MPTGFACGGYIEEEEEEEEISPSLGTDGEGPTIRGLTFLAVHIRRRKRRRLI
jgi:hypothetical protein